MPEDDTTVQHRPGSRPDLPTADIGAMLAQILSGQQDINSRIGKIQVQLAGATTTLETAAKTAEDAQALKVKIVEIETKLSLVMWLLALVGTVAIGAIGAAFFALILRSSPPTVSANTPRLGEPPPYYAQAN